MNNPFLWQKMLDIQTEYRDLLHKLRCFVETDDFRYIINEIGIFWYSKKKAVELFLQNVSENYDAFLFCGATYLDVKENEHYPLLSVGNVHIVDDPLAKYSDTIKKSMNDAFYHTMKQQIILSFYDDVEIMDTMLGDILLLPVTDSAKFSELLDKSDPAMDLFCSMLDEPIDIKQLCSIVDFDCFLSKFRKDALNTIVFSEEDTPEESIRDKLERHLIAVGDPFGDVPLGQKFIFVVLGYFNQALDIFAMCAQYRLIPYIRYDVVFRYMMVIGGNFIDNKDIRTIIEGMIFGHFFYYYFDIQAVAGLNIEMYRQKVNEVARTNLYWNPAIADCPFQMEIGDSIKKAAQSLASKICTAFADREE